MIIRKPHEEHYLPALHRRPAHMSRKLSAESRNVEKVLENQQSARRPVVLVPRISGSICGTGSGSLFTVPTFLQYLPRWIYIDHIWRICRIFHSSVNASHSIEPTDFVFHLWLFEQMIITKSLMTYKATKALVLKMMYKENQLTDRVESDNLRVTLAKISINFIPAMVIHGRLTVTH